MKIHKRKFLIVKTSDKRYNIALRSAPEHPLTGTGFPNRRAAKKRLIEYIKKVNATMEY